MTSTATPIHRLVIYRPKSGHFEALKAILATHGAVLRATALLTDEPVDVWVAKELHRDRTAPAPYFIESFWYKSAEACDLAHQTPEVMAVWETIGPHLDSMTLITLEAA